MIDAIFTVDDDNAVIRYYPSRVPASSPSAGRARRAVIATLQPSLQALAEYLERVTGATWTVVDAEAHDEAHTFLCHSDGSTCEDGCDHAADPAQIAAYLQGDRQ